MPDPREPIPDEWIDAALAADAEWMRASRSVVFVSPSRDQVRWSNPKNGSEGEAS